MKKLCEKISSNGRQILEIVALIIVTSIPWVVDLQEIFKECLLGRESSGMGLTPSRDPGLWRGVGWS